MRDVDHRLEPCDFGREGAAAGGAAMIVAALACFAMPSRARAQTPPRAVLVTGAGSGIGRAIAERLAAAGFFVYAGARSPQELAQLNAIANVQAMRLDVTSAADIAAAVETVTKGPPTWTSRSWLTRRRSAGRAPCTFTQWINARWMCRRLRFPTRGG